MKIRCYITVVLSAFFCVTGCDSSTNDEIESSTSNEIIAFNLIDISAADSAAKTMTLTWQNASDATGITYYICEKDTSKENNCNALTSVTDTLTVTLTVESIVNALNRDYFILAINSDNEIEASNESNLSTENATQMIGYFKADNPESYDQFGISVALNDEGTRLAIGALNSKNVDDSVSNSGSVYIFDYNSDNGWSQSAQMSASDAQEYDLFGHAVAFNSDGTTLAVSAIGEDEKGTASGSVYLFNYDESTGWAEQNKLTADNGGVNDNFGYSLALNNDGSQLAVGAKDEDGPDSGIYTDTLSLTSDTNDESNHGAVYIFDYDSSSKNWSQSYYIKAYNPTLSAHFGISVAFDSDGAALLVGADGENNNRTGIINGDSVATESGTLNYSGAAYLYTYSGSGWKQSAYFKASNAGEHDHFGNSVAINSDATTIAIGAYNESAKSSGIVINSAEITENDDASKSGAVYLFSYDGDHDEWSQTSYIKPSNNKSKQYFGYSLALSHDGLTLAVGTSNEDTDSTGILTNGTEVDIDAEANYSGAVYLFNYDEGWNQSAYIKASNTGNSDTFGIQVALNSDGSTLAVGANQEDNSAAGIINDASEMEGDENNTQLHNSGAVYLY